MPAKAETVNATTDHLGTVDPTIASGYILAHFGLPPDRPATRIRMGTEMENSRYEFDGSDTTSFLNHIYSVSVDPERMVDLVESWERQNRRPDAGGERTKPGGRSQSFAEHDRIVEALDKVISAHASRIAELLSGFRTAAFIFNTSGLIVAANEAASMVLNIMPGNRLADLEIATDDFDELEEKISGLVGAKTCGDAIVRFRPAGFHHSVLAHLRAVDADSSGRHVVMVTSENHWPESLTKLLYTTYAITEREAFVLQCITRGETVGVIAAASNKSEPTIRSQIQSLLQKTGLSSQFELVRMATTLLHSVGGSEAGGTATKTGKELPIYALTPLALPDGRKIHYRFAGAAFGRPFLLLPSGQGFIRWTDEAEREMERRNLKMIAPVRAGYGPSSAWPAHRNIYDCIADDTAYLLDQLGLQSCPVVAICDDFKIALHIDRRHPGRFSAVVGAAPTMPLSSPEQFARLTKFVRFIQSNATYAPRTLPYVSLLFFHMGRRLGTKRFLETMRANLKRILCIDDKLDIQLIAHVA